MATAQLLLLDAFRFERVDTHSARRFISDDAQTMTAFPAEPMHQAPRVFMCQTAGFASAIAQHRPTTFL